MSPAEQPSVVPRVGLALSMKGATGTELSYAVEAIDRVHGDGVLPLIPVKFVGGRKQEGAFRTVDLPSHYSHKSWTLDWLFASSRDWPSA